MDILAPRQGGRVILFGGGLSFEWADASSKIPASCRLTSSVPSEERQAKIRLPLKEHRGDDDW